MMRFRAMNEESINQEPQARSISLFPSCAPTPVISPMLIKVGTAEW